MQKFYTIFGIGMVIVIALNAYAITAIPFIYTNRYFVLLAIAYVLLVVWFSCYLIYGIFLEEKDLDGKDVVEKMRKNKSFAYFTIFILPLAFSFFLSNMLPIAVDAFSSNTVVREYRLVKIKLERRRYGSKSIGKIYATDRARKPITFRLKKHILNKLNLDSDENFLVKGRNSYFGLVIDKINGVELQ